MRLNLIVVCLISLGLYRCGSILGDSYEEDVSHDLAIVNEIIQENPVLQSAVDSGHYFLPTDAEYGRITGRLDLSGIGLNDSNFHFPVSIGDFKLVKTVSISSNDFSDLPVGTRGKKWERVVVWYNKMCDPSAETVEYLDKLMDGFPGGYWRDSQRCDDSIPVAAP